MVQFCMSVLGMKGNPLCVVLAYLTWRFRVAGKDGESCVKISFGAFSSQPS